ncbi:unnamed protein product [Schistosoma mattheei]|uniref:Uncharacterized protein n=1 Tax=Schistosoma mattheei TaxID=31246 RepID=A0A183PZT6_9TREM|nr:unnamed protein product [Schistosoma mattheei]
MLRQQYRGSYLKQRVYDIPLMGERNRIRWFTEKHRRVMPTHSTSNGLDICGEIHRAEKLSRTVRKLHAKMRNE